MTKVTLQDIKNAKETIKDIVKQTDILESAKLSAMTGANVFYKCENLQKTGSFKVRGKLSVAANISREEMEKVAMEDEKIKALVEGKTIVKVVAVPKKLVNIVVK